MSAGTAKGMLSHAGGGDAAGTGGPDRAVVAGQRGTDGHLQRPWRHDPGRLFTDVAAAVAHGGDCVSKIRSLADRRDQHASWASVTTAWRLLVTCIDASRQPGPDREGVPGLSPDAPSRLVVDLGLLKVDLEA